MTTFSFRKLFSNPDAILSRANAARDDAEWTAAAEQYGKYLSLTPDDAPIWVQLGHAKKEAGDASGALSAYLRALSIAPGVADTHLMLGHLRKMMGDLPQAAAHYADAVAYDPDALDPLVQLAFAEKDLGHDTAALAHFREIQRRDPDNREAADLVRALTRATYKARQASLRKETKTPAPTLENLSRTVKAVAVELLYLLDRADETDTAMLRLETSLTTVERDIRNSLEKTEASMLALEARSPVTSQSFQALLDHINAQQKLNKASPQGLYAELR